MSVQLALWMFPALLTLIFLGFPVAFSLIFDLADAPAGGILLLAISFERTSTRPSSWSADFF